MRRSTSLDQSSSLDQFCLARALCEANAGEGMVEALATPIAIVIWVSKEIAEAGTRGIAATLTETAPPSHMRAH